MRRHWAAVAGLGLLLVVACSGPGEARPSAVPAQGSPAAATAAPTVSAGSSLGSAPAPTGQARNETQAPAGTATATPSAMQAPPPPAAQATNPPAAVPALPLLVLTSPAEGTTEVAAGTKSITVAGRSRPDAVVSVNGNLVAPGGDGNFRVDVPLSDEVTFVEVIASDATGRLVREQRVVVQE